MLNKTQRKAIDTMFRKVARGREKSYFTEKNKSLSFVKVENYTAQCTNGFVAIQVDGYSNDNKFINPLNGEEAELTEYTYPDLEKFYTGYDNENKSFLTPTNMLYRELKSLHEKDKEANIIRLTIEDGKIKLSSLDKLTKNYLDGGYSNINKDAEKLVIHFDYKKLRDVLLLYKQLKVSDLNLSFIAPLRPMRFTGKGVDTILSPMRIGGRR